MSKPFLHDKIGLLECEFIMPSGHLRSMYIVITQELNILTHCYNGNIYTRKYRALWLLKSLDILKNYTLLDCLFSHVRIGVLIQYLVVESTSLSREVKSDNAKSGEGVSSP